MFYEDNFSSVQIWAETSMFLFHSNYWTAGFKPRTFKVIHLMQNTLGTSLKLWWQFYFSTWMVRVSVTRLGDFRKFLVSKFITKVAQIFRDFWAILKRVIFKVKTSVATFWASFGGNWATFHYNIWSHWYGCTC